METSIIFNKTGNFWIDNGIVGLYRIICPYGIKYQFYNQDGQLIDYECELEFDKLVIMLISPKEIDENKKSKIKGAEIHPDLLTILNTAKNEVVKNHLTETGAGWIFKNEQFEVYDKTDFKMHLKSFFTGKTPLTEGALCVPDSKDSDLGAKGRRMTEDEYKKFVVFKEAHSPIIKNDRKYPLTGKGFLNSKPKYQIGDTFESSFINIGKKQCAFSGEMFEIADSITGMDYPFLTGKSGELNFASYLNSKPSISAKYAYVALFSFYNLHFLLQEDLKSYFILYDSSLRELNKFYGKISVDLSQLKAATYCNFQNDIIGTQYEYETLFAFIISIFNQLKGKLKADERKEIYTKTIFTFTNDGNIFRDVKEYSSLEAFFKLLDIFDEESHISTFINFIKFFQKKVKQNEYDTTWRNRICADLLAFRSIAQTIEAFLSEVKMKEESGIPNLNDIIEIYYKQQNQLNMDNNVVDMCKRIGNSIGRYCRETDDKGILFSIRNSRNRIDFLKVLSESQFRTGVLYSEEFFDGLPNTPQWEEYKSLVSIFAMNSYLAGKKEKQTTETPKS